MAGTERTVKCSECGTERTTRAGTGTALKCPKGHIFRAPAPVAETPSPPAPAPRVKRAKAAQTVVRQNARPKPKKDSPAAGEGDSSPTPPPPAASTEAPTPGGGNASPPSGPARKPKGGDPETQREYGRRGGLGYYQRLVRRAS